MYNRAIGEKGKPTIYFDDENKKALSVSGIRATRNNNPGNLEYGEYTKKNGAIGTDSRFAIFPDVEVGFLCMKNLILNSKKYKGKSVQEIVLIYAPSFENNCEEYIRAIEKNTGFSRDFVPKFEVDILKLCRGMAKHEGFYSKIERKEVEWYAG